MSNSGEEINDETHEVRTRAPSRKGYHNLLVNRTSTFNKATKNLQKDIEQVNKSMEDPEMLEKASDTLKDSKEHYERLLEELEQLFLQDKWGEAVSVKPTVQTVSKRYLEAVDIAIHEASSRIKNLHASQERKSTRTADTLKLSFGLKLPKTPVTPVATVKRSADTSELNLASTSSRISRRSRYSGKTATSRSPLQSERTKALADVAAAKEQAGHDMLMAEGENARKLQQAQEELKRAKAQAQHDHDMAILKARKLEAVAKAKLDAIEQSIEEEENILPSTSWRSSPASSKRTQEWVQSQPLYHNEAEERIDQEDAEKVMVYSTPHTGSRPQRPVLPQTHDANKAQQPIDVVQQCMGAMATTNERLTSRLARLSLPKCHPDVFSGDATMFLPWKSAFKGMIKGCKVTPDNEMNYLCMYTTGEPQRLVNSYRKRRHKDLRTLVKELWSELERRFGNVAVITNAFLSKLKESAKFGENDRKKLQAFLDLCSDVASQVNQLPGLECLNYPSTIQPILYNLPESLRVKWDKQVVEFTSKNRDAYPTFAVFASMIESQSLLKNHPNVTVIDKRLPRDCCKPPIPPPDPLSTVLKGEVTIGGDTKETYCAFHKCNGHMISECKAFAKKTLDEKTQWIRQERLCFRCLLPNHIAKQCKTDIKCGACGSVRHPTLLHKVVKNAESDEVTTTQTRIGSNAGRNYSCSKIVLLNVFQQRDPLTTKRVYAIIDEQSNASMISPELVNEFGINAPHEKYLLSACSGSKKQSLVVESRA